MTPEEIAKAVEHKFINCELLSEYFDLFKNEYKGKGEKHHIFPKSMFPEYKTSRWNLVNLSQEDHLKAHEILIQIVANKKDWHRMVCAYNLLAKSHRVKTSEFLELMRVANTGDNNPMYGKRGELNPNFGKPLSEERRKNISESLKGEKHPQFGIKRSKQFCDNLSAKLKGRQFSEEHCANISKSMSAGRHPMFGKHKSEQTKQKIREKVSGENNGGHGKVRGSNPNAKRILVEGIEFESLLDAAEHFNVNKCTIGRWLKKGRAVYLTTPKNHDTSQQSTD